MSLHHTLRRLSLLNRCLGLAVCAVALHLAGCEKKEAPKPPPAEVTAVTLAPRTVPLSAEFVAQVESSHQVEILARVSGFLEKILYKEGDVVRAGQVMFKIDPKPFQAQVAAARGEVENRQAQLWTAKSNLDRVRPLAALDAASLSDLDNATGEVQAAEAALYSAKANLDKAELDLGYTTIAAPVTGVSGQALFREGTYLTAGASSRLSYVAKLDPIWVTFSISQNQMAQRQQAVAAGEMIRPVDLQYQVEVELSDGSRYPYLGKLNFISSVFNQETGTFLVRAELPNPNGALRPGMFVKAIAHGDTRPNSLVVPQKAVQQTSNGHVVYLISPQGTAEIRPVIVGDWVGNDWVIKQGLKAGEQVIVDGFQRLAPGAPVKVVGNQTQPATPTPSPAAAPETTTKSAPPAPAPAKAAAPAAPAAPAKPAVTQPPAKASMVAPDIKSVAAGKPVAAPGGASAPSGQLLLGVLATHDQVRAEQVAGELGKLLGQPVVVRRFEDEATLVEWFQRYRMLDLAVIPNDERGDLLAGNYHLLQSLPQEQLVAKRDLPAATLEQLTEGFASNRLTSPSQTVPTHAQSPISLASR